MIGSVLADSGNGERVHGLDYSSSRRHFILNGITVTVGDGGSVDRGCGVCRGGRYFFVIDTTVARQEIAES